MSGPGDARRAGARRRPIATLAVLLGLSACLEPTYGYLAHPDAGFALRYPRDWDEVTVAPTGSEWVRAVDAAEPPSGQHLGTFTLDDPFLVAQVLPLGAADADSYTLAQLRELAHPERVDPATVGDGSVRIDVDEVVLTEDGFEGHHLRFDVDLEGGTATVEHFAALAPDRGTVYRVRVACREACFDRHAGDIGDVFDSIDLDG